MRYRDLVKTDEPVWTNSMRNKLGCLSQGYNKHAGTDTIDFIKEKPGRLFHKHHPIWHHRNIRPIYLKPTKKDIEN